MKTIVLDAKSYEDSESKIKKGVPPTDFFLQAKKRPPKNPTRQKIEVLCHNFFICSPIGIKLRSFYSAWDRESNGVSQAWFWGNFFLAQLPCAVIFFCCIAIVLSARVFNSIWTNEMNSQHQGRILHHLNDKESNSCFWAKIVIFGTLPPFAFLALGPISRCFRAKLGHENCCTRR